MSIISSSPALNAIVKGTPATFTLDKAELALNSIVAASPYYSDMANWDKVTVVYRSSVGNQSEKVVFDATQTTPTASFSASATARDIFEVVRVTIFDFDSGYISVQRVDLVTAEFDVDMTPPPPTNVWDIFYGNVGSTGGGELHKTLGTSDWGDSARSTVMLSGDFSFTGTWNVVNPNPEAMVGYTKLPQLTLPAGPEFDTSLYTHSNQTNLYIGPNNTAVASSARIIVIGNNLFEIIRVSGIITAKVDGQTIFTDSYAGNVYIGASIYFPGGFSIISSVLV